MVTIVQGVRAGPPGIAERQDEVWRVILDHVFADAVLSDVGTLRIYMPDGLHAESVSIRRELVEAVPGTRTAVAWLAARTPMPETLQPADRFYTLMTFGRFLPGRLRSRGRRRLPRIDSWFVYPWDTWILGLLMRGFGRLRWPEWQDRALFALRSRLVRRQFTWCAYVLTVADAPGAAGAFWSTRQASS